MDLLLDQHCCNHELLPFFSFFFPLVALCCSPSGRRSLSRSNALLLECSELSCTKCVDTQPDCVDTTGFNYSNCFLGQSSSVDTQVDCVDTTACLELFKEVAKKVEEPKIQLEAVRLVEKWREEDQKIQMEQVERELEELVQQVVEDGLPPWTDLDAPNVAQKLTPVEVTVVAALAVLVVVEFDLALLLDPHLTDMHSSLAVESHPQAGAGPSDHPLIYLSPLETLAGSQQVVEGHGGSVGGEEQAREPEEDDRRVGDVSKG
ncbi:hypothetical protein Taro_001215 [Colocasia esculenta]|uniref:Uncharacterized protein n=1 Tax=Colocasia esculenta TaxID=4460 RepID=A0A843TJZ3_COLES|nr:hypothetical protein [Colocasia esculenta]